MNYDGKNGNGYQPLPSDKGGPPRATKLTREAERASLTGDFYKLAEMHNKQALELIETVLAKHTATMLEAIHALASRPVEAAQGEVVEPFAFTDERRLQAVINQGAGSVWRTGKKGDIPLYLRPAPPGGVPEAQTKDDYEPDEHGEIDTYAYGHMDGWNSCREAMLAAAPEVE